LKKQNRETGTDYFTLAIRDYGFVADFGKVANQDDGTLQSVNSWGLGKVYCKRARPLMRSGDPIGRQVNSC